MNDTPATSKVSRIHAPPSADLAHRDHQREGFEQHREQEQAEHERREGLDRFGIQQRVHAMIDIHAAADEEYADRGDQRPEEFLLTAAKRVFGVRTAPAPYFPDLEQYLVGDVGERVDRLGEERWRAGDEPAEALGRGDRSVRENGGGDGGGHARVLVGRHVSANARTAPWTPQAPAYAGRGARALAGHFAATVANVRGAPQ